MPGDYAAVVAEIAGVDRATSNHHVSERRQLHETSVYVYNIYMYIYMCVCLFVCVCYMTIYFPSSQNNCLAASRRHYLAR